MKTVKEITLNMERQRFYDEELRTAVSEFLVQEFRWHDDEPLGSRDLFGAVEVLRRFGDVEPAFRALLDYVEEKMLEARRPHDAHEPWNT
jgi:hypothetical protein